MAECGQDQEEKRAEDDGDEHERGTKKRVQKKQRQKKGGRGVMRKKAIDMLCYTSCFPYLCASFGIKQMVKHIILYALVSAAL